MDLSPYSSERYTRLLLRVRDKCAGASVESHLMGIAAEKSRLAGGEPVYVHK